LEHCGMGVVNPPAAPVFFLLIEQLAQALLHKYSEDSGNVKE
jgi:hypothetical protein